MSEDEVRTSEEECICAVVAEACFACGGTPKEFEELIKRDPYLSEMYHKEPYFFKSECINNEDDVSKDKCINKEEDAPFNESIDIYF